MHLSRLGLLVHLVASLPWWHPSTSALPWHPGVLAAGATLNLRFSSDAWAVGCSAF